MTVNKDLMDKDLIPHLKSDYPTSEIWAWTVNDLKEMQRLEKLKVNGIITDNWKQ